MRTTILIIAATLMLAACGDEWPAPEDNLSGNPQDIAGPIVTGRYGLMNIKSTTTSGVSKDLSFVGLLSFDYYLVRRDATGDTYQEEILGTVTMGQDKLDCSGVQYAEVGVDQAGKVLKYKIIANPCTRTGIFAKPLASPVMSTQGETNDLVWSQKLSGGVMELHANLVQL